MSSNAYCAWSKEHLDVAILPPTSPVLYTNENWHNRIVLGPDWVQDQVHGLEVLPHGAENPWTSTYARATQEAIEAWERTMHAYARDNPEHSHLENVTIETRVVDENDVEYLEDADIVVAFPPSQGLTAGRTTVYCGPVLGSCVTTLGGTSCVDVSMMILQSEWWLYSFSENDMYNVILHEFGHALGLKHVSLSMDVMYGTYKHGLGNPTNPRECPSNLNLRQLSNGFAWIGGAEFQDPPPGVDMPLGNYELLC